MNTKLFDQKFRDKGGIEKLQQMKNSIYTLKRIGEHFGVGRVRVHQWMREMFGEKYDPRKRRRQLKIEYIKIILMKEDRIEAIKQLKNINLYYFGEALKELNKEI